LFVHQGTRQAAGEVVYTDDELDLAVIHVESAVFPKALIDLNSKPSVGESVFAIGAPLGLEHSISQGIISSIRSSQHGTTLIQFTAPISPGNSGGGLFDDRARLLGITTFKLKGGENLNFAIDVKPINDIDVVLFVSDLLRRVAESQYAQSNKLYSTADLSSIRSQQLTKWLLHSTQPSGSPYWQDIVSVQLAFRKLQSPSLEQVENYFVQLTRVLAKFIASRKSRGAENPITTNPSITMLVCTLVDQRGVQRGDITLYVDSQKSTVTGIPAEISESEVRFPFGDSFVAILNRFTGSIRMSTEGAPDFITGNCAKAAPAQRKF
jgi:hypothetical protein